MTKAKDVLKRGLENNPEPKIKEKLLIQLFEIAVTSELGKGSTFTLTLPTKGRK